MRMQTGPEEGDSHEPPQHQYDHRCHANTSRSNASRFRTPRIPTPRTGEHADATRHDGLVGQDSVKVIGEFLSRVVPLARLFFETLQANRFEVAGDGPVETAEAGGFTVHHL